MISARKSKRRKERGVTLLSLSLGFAMSVVMAAGAMTFYNSLDRQTTAKRVLEEVELIKNAVVRTWAGKSDFSGVSVASLIAAGLVPNSMIDGTQIKHAAARPITIAPADNGCVGCNNALQIVLLEVPDDMCQRIVGRRFGEDIYRIVVGEEGARTTYTIPFDISAMQDDCETPDGNAGIEIFIRR